MTERCVEATAPTRVDLAGGTLDIWPLYLLHPGAVTVNVAIDRRAWCRVEAGGRGIRLESRDTSQTAEAGNVDEILAAGKLTLAGFILRALGIETGVRVVMNSEVPAGSGLGGSSALAVTIAAAAARAFGRTLGNDALVALVRDAEAQAIRIPTGVQDYWAALRGGVQSLALHPGGPRSEPLAVDAERVEESLLLVDAGVTRFSGLNNWEVFKRRIDGDPGVTQSFDRIAAVARCVRESLLAHRYEDVGVLLTEEWEARKCLATGISTAEIDAIVVAARAAGAGAKVCGAGGGGMVAVWAPPGATREAALAALAGRGFSSLPFRVDRGGLRVDEL